MRKWGGGDAVAAPRAWDFLGLLGPTPIIIRGVQSVRRYESCAITM